MTGTTAHELAPIVGVEPEQGERKKLPRQPQGLQHRLLAAMAQCQTLGPGGGDVGQHQRVQEGALGPIAAVGHQSWANV